MSETHDEPADHGSCYDTSADGIDMFSKPQILAGNRGTGGLAGEGRQRDSSVASSPGARHAKSRPKVLRLITIGGVGALVAGAAVTVAALSSGGATSTAGRTMQVGPAASAAGSALMPVLATGPASWSAAGVGDPGVKRTVAPPPTEPAPPPSESAPPSATTASTPAYDNAGISNDNAPASGAFDGGVLGYSAQALAADGFVSGQRVTVSGISFNWPSADVPDNIVCGGQTVSIGGSGSTLGILGASNNGTAAGTGTIVYTDGTTQSFELSFSDWWNGTPTGGTSVAATAAYLDQGPDAAKGNTPTYVFYAGIPLDPGKTVHDVELPDVTPNGEAKQVTALHIFAMSIAS
jgi:beta-glucosidase